jgi:hypothetical protein
MMILLLLKIYLAWMREESEEKKRKKIRSPNKERDFSFDFDKLTKGYFSGANSVYDEMDLAIGFLFPGSFSTAFMPRLLERTPSAFEMAVKSSVEHFQLKSDLVEHVNSLN